MQRSCVRILCAAARRVMRLCEQLVELLLERGADACAKVRACEAPGFVGGADSAMQDSDGNSALIACVQGKLHALAKRTVLPVPQTHSLHIFSHTAPAGNGHDASEADELIQVPDRGPSCGSNTTAALAASPPSSAAAPRSCASSVGTLWSPPAAHSPATRSAAQSRKTP